MMDVTVLSVKRFVYIYFKEKKEYERLNNFSEMVTRCLFKFPSDHHNYLANTCNSICVVVQLLDGHIAWPQVT